MVPAADLRFFDSGHFVLDENADAVAEAIIETFSESVDTDAVFDGRQHTRAHAGSI